MSYLPIANHGIIGNLNTTALVGMDGCIDFLCFPYFDSPSVFASLLDSKNGGRFKIAPILEEAMRKQLYLPDSNILLTRFLSEEGVGEISDFMPVEAPWPVHAIVRRAKAVRGDIRFRMTCAPRFDYGRAEHRVEIRDGAVWFHSQGPDKLMLRLKGSIPLRRSNGDATAEFTLRHGETAYFVLERMEADETGFVLDEEWMAKCFKDTLNFWRNWIGRSLYRGRWREIVNRSALLLKLLTSSRHGSMVAAPTFGLPEQLGGGRNWDYRYTWIRDASFTVYALMRLGFTEEAGAFFRWLEQRSHDLEDTSPLRVLYGLDGRRGIDETILTHFEGYRQSKPVRIGNAAGQQLQLDIYGELIDAVYIYDKSGQPITFDFWQRLVKLTDWVCRNWHQADEGIWEVRGGRQEFLFSRVMCWVAVDRAIRLAQKRNFPGPLDDWDKVRRQIHEDVHRNFWNPEIDAFVQHKGSKAVDAASLLMPLVRFIPPNDTRWFHTMKRIEKVLVEDSLVYRYDPDRAANDGLDGGEGTFSMCSFWYVECMSRSGEVQKARFLFEKALSYANHLGLYSEELGPRGEHLGNFPQAFTHLALISAAYNVDRKLDESGIA
jgi:GH15 family glucan-1,4-alpha-glucosidase